MNSNLSFKLLDYRRNWKTVEGQWFDLFNTSQHPCAFYHPIFLSASEALSEEDQPTHLILGYQGERCIFGLPARIKHYKLLIRELSIHAIYGADHIAPLDITPNQNATRQFFGHYLRSQGFNAINATSLNGEFIDILEKVLSPRYSTFRRRTFRCPYLSLPKKEDQLLASLSSNFRSQIRRRHKQAEESRFHFRVVLESTSSYSLQDAFTNLYLNHKDRAQDTNRTSVFLRESVHEFHKRICEDAKRYHGTVHFFELLHHENVIACLYGFLFGNRFYYLQSGFRHEYSDFSVGVLVMYYTLLYLINRGVDVFDFLRGAEAYKFKWTNTWENNYLIFAGASPLGKSFVHLHRLRRAFKRYGRVSGTRAWLRNED